MTKTTKSKMAEDQQYMLLSGGEREYVEMTEEQINEKYKRPDLARRQFSIRIKHRAINAIAEIAWLCDKLPEDELKKIFSNESVESTFKIQEKALAVSEYTLGEEYEAEVKLSSGETVKVKRGKGYNAGNCWRLEEHIGKEIDALVFNTGGRKILKKYLRVPDDLIYLLNDLWKREHRILELEYNHKLITTEEYSKRLKALHDKLGELPEY